MLRTSCIPFSMILNALYLLFLTALIVVISCDAALRVDPLLREILVVNNCGCVLLILSCVGDDNDERFLGKTEIANGTDISITGYVGEELKVMEIANVTGNCTDREATFQINDNFGQGELRRKCSMKTAVVFVNLIQSLL
jgi:hypothetical protein